MEVHEVLKSSNMLVITFTIPIVKDDDKKIHVRVLFDLNSSVMKVKQNIAELVSIITITTYINIASSVKITNIELSTNIEFSTTNNTFPQVL